MRPVIGVAWPKTDYVASLERAGADVRDPDAGRSTRCQACWPIATACC